MVLSLAGQWNAWLTQDTDAGMPSVWPEKMTLPGTTSQQGMGPVNQAKPEGYLTDLHAFEGVLWLERFFTLEQDAAQLMFTLERTRMTALWVDGQLLGHGDSLCTPHRFFAEKISAGQHRLVIRVANVGYPTKGGHMTSPDTQTNWLGITGEISVTAGEALVWDVQSEVQPDLRSLRIRAKVKGADSVRITVNEEQPEEASVTNGMIDTLYNFKNQPPLWEMKHPRLLTLCIQAGDMEIRKQTGIRRLSTEGRSLLLNGNPVFLRGTHDGMAFPLTGAAPTDIEAWRTYFGIVKDWGINHVRYHTCCPPEAAFAAADELGLLMEPELPFWGTIAAPGEEGYNEKEQRYLTDQGLAILREFGSHPSFCMMSMGNELWGNPDRLDSILAQIREGACDKLYTSGSNCFQFVPRVLPHEDFFVGVRLAKDRLFRGSYAMCDAPQGIVQVTEPESIRDYDKIIAPVEADASVGEGTRLIQYGTGVKEVSAGSADALIPEVPVISHEIGQYVFYPDFSEMEHYTGPLKPRNFEVFQERLQANGLWQDHERFFRAAGHLAADCYRRELETALRSRELSGFQLLDLKDFPGQGTALVGVLNALMENKGILSPEQWRRFCDDTVVMARLERFVLVSGQELRCPVCVSECDPTKKHCYVRCDLLQDGRTLSNCVLEVPQAEGRVIECGTADLGVLTADKPCSLLLRLVLDDDTINEYPLWLFPAGEAVITEEGISLDGQFVRFVSSQEKGLSDCGPFIVIPGAEDRLPAEYCADFWCYSMFRDISDWMKKPPPVGTMGLCIDPQHPVLAGFPCEEWTTPPWYRLLRHAHCEPLEQACDLPVQMIDNVTRAQRLGILWIKDGVLHTTIRLWEAADEPEARALASSMARFVLSRRDFH